MPQNKDLKRLVRERMQQTGERYTQALAHIVRSTPLEPLPPSWFMGGDCPGNYEFGRLPLEIDHQGARVVRLRSKGAEDAGFGTMMQSFGAGKYLGHRIRLRAELRSIEVTGWAGLWMRVDDANGKMIAFDNMQHRSLTGTTDWAPAAVVLDVTAEAASIHFGVLLSREGAVDLATLGFEEVDDTVALTSITRLSDEPQDLNFDPA